MKALLINHNKISKISRIVQTKQLTDALNISNEILDGKIRGRVVVQI